MAGILLIDEAETRVSCARVLENSGHACLHASSCGEAMQYLRVHRPDLVVLNPHLGGREGLHTLEAIKQFDPDLCVMLYAEASLFGDPFDYFLANGSLVKLPDHRQLLMFIRAKFAHLPSPDESLHFQGEFF